MANPRVFVVKKDGFITRDELVRKGTTVLVWPRGYNALGEAKIVISFRTRRFMTQHDLDRLVNYGILEEDDELECEQPYYGLC